MQKTFGQNYHRIDLVLSLSVTVAGEQVAGFIDQADEYLRPEIVIVTHKDKI